MITLLLVDDYQPIRTLVRHYAARTTDIQVVGEAGNGAEAVALAAALRPDVVLMDVQMPDMDGIAATSTLRDIAPHSAVVMFSSDDDSNTRELARAAGARAFVAKGDSQAVLLAAIRSVGQYKPAWGGRGAAAIPRPRESYGG
jgi:DNA-binding NarL/FixJ family response regulator